MQKNVSYQKLTSDILGGLTRKKDYFFKVV
jgi:hypothetical protein